MDKLSLIRHNIQESIRLKQFLHEDKDSHLKMEQVSQLLVDCFRNGGKVLFCGNGGSAADAQHIAAELSGRLYYDRPPLNAEALHVNTSYLTAVANDYSYDQIYARLIEGKGRKGDILVGLSTSGNSPNVVLALAKAKESGLRTIGLTGKGGGKMDALCDVLFTIPSKDTPRIQECHMLIGHTLCHLVESELFPRE